MVEMRFFALLFLTALGVTGYILTVGWLFGLFEAPFKGSRILALILFAALVAFIFTLLAYGPLAPR